MEIVFRFLNILFIILIFYYSHQSLLILDPNYKEKIVAYFISLLAILVIFYIFIFYTKKTICTNNLLDLNPLKKILEV